MIAEGTEMGVGNFAVVESKELEDKDDVIIGYGSVARRLGYVGWLWKSAARRAALHVGGVMRFGAIVFVFDHGWNWTWAGAAEDAAARGERRGSAG